MNPSFSDPVRRPRRFLVWGGLWGGGCAWLAHFLAVWALAEFGCQSGAGEAGPGGISKVAWLVLGTTLLALVPAGLAAWASRRLGGEDEVSRFAARFGVVANPLFMLIIVAETVPVFFHLKDCGRYIG